MKKIQDGILLLETGVWFKGKIFGHTGEAFGEVIFNTGIVGYEEVITDPSYKGQIVVMTYPHIGNYGINYEDFESIKPQVEGFVVRELSKTISNWRAKDRLELLFKKHKIVGIENIDTRAVTKYIRDKGSMRGVISSNGKNIKKLLSSLLKYPKIEGRDIVKYVTCDKIYEPFTNPILPLKENKFSQHLSTEEKYKVVVIDCGCKFNILRLLREHKCKLVVVPAETNYEKILKLCPDGIFLSNGPGDPEGVPYVFKTVEKLINYQIQHQHYIPIFGICLGHQMLALALGGKTYKLKFGHHGINHPVKNFYTEKIEITSQNHNFAVKMLQTNGKWEIEGNNELEVTHINLNDYSSEGLQHKKLPIFSVQYHPEASPGPNDSKYLFDKFTQLIRKYKQKR